MSDYILDALEALIYENTGQPDLVRRRIIGYLGGAEIVRIKKDLAAEWQQWLAEEAAAEDADDTHYDIPDDFTPYDPSDDDM